MHYMRCAFSEIEPDTLCLLRLSDFVVLAIIKPDFGVFHVVAEQIRFVKVLFFIGIVAVGNPVHFKILSPEKHILFLLKWAIFQICN